MTAHSLCQHDCVSWFRTQRTLVEQGSAPTSHLALQVLLVEDQRILLQQFVHHSQHVNMLQLLQPLATLVVSRESCLQLGMSDLHCPFSVSCRARSVIVQCWPVAFVAFPHVMFKLLVTSPHRVWHCIPWHCATQSRHRQRHAWWHYTLAKLCLSVGSCHGGCAQRPPTFQSEASGFCDPWLPLRIPFLLESSML